MCCRTDYYIDDCFTAERATLLFLMQSRISIADFISVLHIRFQYFESDFFTSKSISLLMSSSVLQQLLNWSDDFFIAESTSLLQSRFLYCRVDFCTTDSNSILPRPISYYQKKQNKTERKKGRNEKKTKGINKEGVREGRKSKENERKKV